MAATAGAFPGGGQIVEIDSTSTIADALHTLTQHGILSAPVFDSKAQRYLGFFDISDVLAVVYGVDLLRHLFPVSKLKEQTVDIHGIKLDLSYSQDAQGVDLPVSRMMQVDGRMAPWWPVNPDGLLVDVVKRLAAKVDAPWSSCRRVPVLDAKTGRVVKVISQSEIVNRVYTNVVAAAASKNGGAAAAPLEPLFIQTPRTHQIGIRPVLCVDGTKDRARRAFEIIVNHRVSAVPVLDASGALVASITNKDIFLLQRIIEHDQQEADAKAAAAAAGGGGKPSKPVKAPRADELMALEFVERAKAFAAAHQLKRQDVTVVAVDHPIHLIIRDLAEKRTHRVFIVDPATKPPAVVGVVSVSDVVKLILDEGLPWPADVLVHHLSD